jgi:hypothetical protein
MGEFEAEGPQPDRTQGDAAHVPAPADESDRNGHSVNGYGLNGHGLNGQSLNGQSLNGHRHVSAHGSEDTLSVAPAPADPGVAANLSTPKAPNALPAQYPAPETHSGRVDRTLSISGALSAWARGLVAAGILLLVAAAAVLALVLVILSPEAWSIDLMIALAGLPVALAVAWIVRRAAGSASDGFVGAVTRTPLVAIAPPPRPGALGSPLAVLRAIGLLPAVFVLLALGVVVAGGDAIALGRSDEALRVGAAAITCDGLLALAALLLALGGAVARAGHAVGERERNLGARFYAVALPDGHNGTATGICAVPEPR